MTGAQGNGEGGGNHPPAASSGAVGRADPRNSLRWYLVLDLFVRLFVWAGAGVLTTVIFAAVGLWPESSPFTSDIGVAVQWGRCAIRWVLLYNLIYVAELVILRLPIPTPREGRYPIGPGNGIHRQVLWSCFIGTLTKARLDPPFPAIIVPHIAHLPPMCWLLGAVFGPRSKSCPTTDPYIIDPHLVEIGRNVVLGHRTTVAGHHVDRAAIVFKRTVIEDDVIVGGDSKVLSGARVKRGAVIAPGSVVLPDTVVGANEFWWGVPARKFRTLTPVDASPADPPPD